MPPVPAPPLVVRSSTGGHFDWQTLSSQVALQRGLAQKRPYEQYTQHFNG